MEEVDEEEGEAAAAAAVVAAAAAEEARFSLAGGVVGECTRLPFPLTLAGLEVPLEAGRAPPRLALVPAVRCPDLPDLSDLPDASESLERTEDTDFLPLPALPSTDTPDLADLHEVLDSAEQFEVALCPEVWDFPDRLEAEDLRE